MLRLDRYKHAVLRAVALGACALGTLILTQQLWPDSWVNLGLLFALISAAALGLNGAIIAVSFGVIPYTLFMGQHLEGLRVIVLLAIVGWAAQYRPRTPTYIATLGAWLLLIGPSLAALQWLNLTAGEWTTNRLLATGLAEVSLAVIAGTLLLNSNLWCWATSRPRYVTISEFMVHVIAAIAIVASLGALVLVHSISGFSWQAVVIDTNSELLWALLLVMVLAITPVLTANRLTRLLGAKFQELFGSQLHSDQKQMSFSGLTSEHWRRQSTLDSPVIGNSQGRGKPTADSPDQHSHGVCALNRDGTITFANRMLHKLLDLREDNILGKNISSLGIDAQICTALLTAIEKTYTKGANVCEVKLRNLSGQLRYFELSCQMSKVIETGDQPPPSPSVIVTVRDITERRTLEDHLLHSQRHASLGGMLRGMMHEFNNTLTAISGHASVARWSRKSKSADDVARVDTCLQEILSATQHAGKMTRQLLDYAEHGPAHMAPQSLKTVIEERLPVLSKTSGEKIELLWKAPADHLPVVCDTNLIMQALSNLLTNARESYSDGGKVEVVLDSETVDESVSSLHIGARPGTFARLRVRDWGCGMNRDVLAKAFEPLFTTKALTGHSGLGLSTVNAIVRAHDGFLTAESHPGKGTTVSLYFPVAQQVELACAKPQSSKLEPEAALSSATSQQILVVEDEPTIRELITTMLGTLGYKVKACADGKEALLLSADETFDLVIVDLVMPRMQGSDLIAELRRSNSKARTLVVTGYAQPANIQSPVLQKPFDLNDLAVSVRSALES